MENIPNTQSTHIGFDGQKVFISPDLSPTFDFLIKIWEEIELLLNFGKNNHLPRTEMIVLFANLEVLLSLNFAYENKINDYDLIRNSTRKKEIWESFYNDFCLSNDNKWVNENREKAGNITAQELRYLRNSLTHFFSVDKGLGISPNEKDENSRKFEKILSPMTKLISPQDLLEIIKSTGLLMIQKWSGDYFICKNNNSNEFKERILSVNEIVKNNGAIIIKK